MTKIILINIYGTVNRIEQAVGMEPLSKEMAAQFPSPGFSPVLPTAHHTQPRIAGLPTKTAFHHLLIIFTGKDINVAFIG